MLYPKQGGPTQSQLSRPMSSGHHISMEHRLRRKQLNSDTNASNKKDLKEIQEKRKEETFSSEKKKMKNIKKSKNEEIEQKMRKIKSKKKDKKTGEKQSWKKRKRGAQRGTYAPRVGPEIDFSHKNCQEKIVRKLRPKKNIRF